MTGEGELYGRARKAARLALAIQRYALLVGDAVPNATIAQVSRSANVRERARLVCGYDHVSDESWAMVEEMLKEVPA
jgi:hypothetical protein